MLIDRVALTPLNIVPLAAGNVMHGMRSSSPGCVGFGEAYFSWILPGAIKGWKRHNRMTLNLIVPVGLVAFALVDPIARLGRIYEIGPEKYARLTVPPGLWMAFSGRAVGPSLLLNVADIEHDPAEADKSPETAFGFDWTAPAWPNGADQRIVS